MISGDAMGAGDRRITYLCSSLLALIGECCQWSLRPRICRVYRCEYLCEYDRAVNVSKTFNVQLRV